MVGGPAAHRSNAAVTTSVTNSFPNPCAVTTALNSDHVVGAVCIVSETPLTWLAGK